MLPHHHYAMQKNNHIHIIIIVIFHVWNPIPKWGHSCSVEKKDRKIEYFFSNKNGPERGRIHAQCAVIFGLPSTLLMLVVASSTIYFVMLFSTEIPQMWKKAEQIYEWTLYMSVCVCRAWCEVSNVNLKLEAYNLVMPQKTEPYFKTDRAR